MMMNDEFLRKKVKVDITQTQYEFQAVEWFARDKIVEDESMDIDEDEYNVSLPKQYIIKAFGVDKEGHSVCCNIRGFTPFFYIKVPMNWTKLHVKKFIDELFNTTGYYRGKPYLPLLKHKKSLDFAKTILQNKKNFYGFTNGEIFKFLRLTFTTEEAMKKVLYLIKNHNDKENKVKIKNAPVSLPLFESNVEPVLRLLHIRNIKPAGWIKAENIDYLQDNKTCKTQIEFDVAWTDLHPLDIFKPAPILQASFDIETYSHDDNFPSPKHPKNSIFQIATSFKHMNEENFKIKTILCLGKTDLIEEEGLFMKVFDSEKDLILYWAKMISMTDPDVLYTYNGDQFDCNYLCERAKLLDIEEEFYSLISRVKDTPAYIKEDGFSSSAYGDNKYMRLFIHGRINFDILIYIKREYKEESYKLDYIAEKYIGENKNPVTAQMMFDFFRSQDSKGLCDTARYCIQDTLLPQKLSDKMHILQNQISMSNVTYVPIKYLIEKGQQIKVFSQILRLTRETNYLIPVIDFKDNKETEEEKFKGATVLEPMVGAYFEPITVCDFASLYPSIMRAHNLCYSTIVLDEKTYGNIDGVSYEVFEWEDVIDGELKKFKYKYAQSTEGILPKLLENLAAERKYYKKLMKEATNKFDKEIYNKCQIAVKVSMNSVYGFLAAFKLRCKPIAATVTAVGRGMILKTKNFIESNYASSVAVYGDTDSVFIKFNTPSLQRYNTERREMKNQVVITDNDKLLLENLKTKCIEEAMAMGTEAAERASKELFKYPISLEYEKVYCPLLMLSKKRYIGKLYSDNPAKMTKLDNKGVVLTRRDNFKLLKVAYQKLIDLYTDTGVVDANKEAIQYINDVMLSIKNNTIDLNDLIISKSLKTGYKSTNIPHVVLANKITERDPNNAPRPNDRIPYIFIDNGDHKKTAQYTKVEDPDYARQNNLPLDAEYYITFLKNPLCEILELFMTEPEKIFSDFLNEYKKERLLKYYPEGKPKVIRKRKIA
jgi:DNA polymerase delta subunit 1